MAKIHPEAWRDLQELGPDDEDDALLAHVLLDDQRPPQGLHQGGYKRIEGDEEGDW